MTDLEKVQQQFANDRFATENGMIVEEVGDHYSKCSVELTERHRNAMGGVMGGVHYTLADFAFAVASNWKDMRTVGLSCSINYVGPVKGSKLIAEARLVKDGRSTCCYNVDIRDDQGNIVAAVQCLGFNVK